MSWLISSGLVGAILFIGCFSLVIFVAVRAFFIWYLDVMILTRKRMVDVHQTGVFRKAVKEVSWIDIQQVVFEKQGMWATLFNYGTIKIALYNNTDVIVLDHVYKPKEIRNLISDYAKTQQ
ncbi:MAG: hypothetical protein Q8P90_01255 [bacterium]|nr:hypothetical protein [bacterium]